LQISQVYKKGKLVAEEGRCLLPGTPKPSRAKLISMNLEEVKQEDLRIQVQGRRLRAIRSAPNTLITDEEIVEVTDHRGWAVSDPERDLLKLAVIERHRGSGRKGLGFVNGFGLKRGALGSTVAHDSHNLMVVGTSDSDMVIAANRLRELGGGLVAVSNGKVRAELPLPVAGLMSPASLEEVVARNREVNQAAFSLGSYLEHPFMVLSFLALPVIPKLKLTDYGLVDVESFAQVDLFVE
jgi:adenine deaminase